MSNETIRTIATNVATRLESVHAELSDFADRADCGNYVEFYKLLGKRDALTVELSELDKLVQPE